MMKAPWTQAYGIMSSVIQELRGFSTYNQGHPAGFWDTSRTCLSLLA
jgi:hypothetical protein